VNFYGYVRNSPVILIDPTGLQAQGGWGLLPPNPNLNTHVCDGHGGQMPQIGNMHNACLLDCVVLHELTHITENMMAFPTICVGQPAGTVIGSSGLTHNNAEVSASNAEINCLKGKLKKDCGQCNNAINQRIRQMEDYRDRRHPYENR
jgi:hypothetical protein